MPRPAEPLPRTLTPLPGEGLPGLLLRLAHRLDLTPAMLLTRTGLQDPLTSYAPSRLLLSMGERLTTFADVTRLTAAEAARLTLAPDTARYPAITESLTGRASPSFPYDAWVFTNFTRYCPRCLAGDGSAIQQRHGGPWKIRWRLPVVFACPEHRTFLHDTCPTCERPAHAFDRAACRLLPRATVGGLHPAQCRNPDGGLTAPARICRTRLDIDTLPALPAVTPSQWALQDRIHRLLDAPTNTTEAIHHFTGLRVLSAVVVATWPVGRDFGFAASSDALEEYVGDLRRRAVDANDPTRVRWDTPPRSALATATLLETADAILALARAELRGVLGSMLHTRPRTAAGRWGRTRLHLQRHAPDRLRREFRAVLTNTTLTRTLVRGPGIRRHQARHPPEHVPQWLPDAWTIHLSSRPANHRARRLAAIRLVQMASDMDLGEAARYLGIPESWWRIDDRRPHSGRRLPRNLFEQDDALARLATLLDAVPAPTDYRHRRTSLDGWTLPGEEWRAIHRRLPPLRHRVDAAYDTRKRQAASEFVWSRVTHSEPDLAPRIPHVIDHSPWFRRNLAGTTAGPPSPHYLVMRRLLDSYATRLALRIDQARSPNPAHRR
ncbi:TniQ family protein [Embleya sp. MST-111070]|uniref:TniQ family protein n=1 Tax=Embleya sp. MST-111070 TaxID=3398231 RepID=UPI003F732620